MDRRDFLTKVRNKTNRYSPTRPFAGGLNPYAGAWTGNEVAHLLKRTMFGATKTDIDHFLAMSPDAAVNELLNTITTPNPPVRDYGLIKNDDDVFFDDLGVVQGQTWINDLNKVSDASIRGYINGYRTDSIHKWWAGLMINQNRSITEKMVLFWHHHFSVQQSEVENATMLWRHHQLLRSNALGNVKQLTKEVTVDPAMLLHLNGYLNSKLAPDENYAREMQELFTIGKGPDSLYTENDVITAARVLTGWRIDSDTLTSYLDANAHDTGSKTFSSFYNNTTINNAAELEVDSLVDMIFNTTESARFICRKLYKWFVYYQIDEDTETNIIMPLANILRSNNFEMKPVLAALFKSEHFFDPSIQACYIKSPYDIIVGTLREFNVSFPAYTNYATGYPLFQAIYDKAAEMQQTLFQPPDVSGWPSYYQEPMQYELWVNSNSLPRRANYTDSLIGSNLIGVKAFANYSSNPSDPNQLINDVTSLLLRYPLSSSAKTYTKNKFLLNNTSDNTVWTNAWNSNSATIVTSLNELFKFIMNLPEFHLC